MRRTTFILATAMLLLAAMTARGQESYTYTVTRTYTRTLRINWRPDEKTHRRYTVSVSPLRLASNGLKFDFERELAKPGHWLGTSIVGYLAGPRNLRFGFWDNEGNNRAWFNSGWDDYHRMWGIGTSLFFKNTFSRRGWYFSTGVVFEFLRVGVTGSSYIPYTENGLTFYDYGRSLEVKSYFKPTAQFNLGKHIALSDRLYFDLYLGLGLSYAFTKNDGRHMYGNRDHYDYGYRDNWYNHRFSSIGGFAYRGLVPSGGFRFGMLLWEPER